MDRFSILSFSFYVAPAEKRKITQGLWKIKIQRWNVWTQSVHRLSSKFKCSSPNIKGTWLFWIPTSESTSLITGNGDNLGRIDNDGVIIENTLDNEGSIKRIAASRSIQSTCGESGSFRREGIHKKIELLSCLKQGLLFGKY